MTAECCRGIGLGEVRRGAAPRRGGSPPGSEEEEWEELEELHLLEESVCSRVTATGCPADEDEEDEDDGGKGRYPLRPLMCSAWSPYAHINFIFV